MSVTPRPILIAPVWVGGRWLLWQARGHVAAFGEREKSGGRGV